MNLSSLTLFLLTIQSLETHPRLHWPVNLCSLRFSLRWDFLASWRTWGTNVCLRSSLCCRPSAGANSCRWSAGGWLKRSMCCLDVQIMTMVTKCLNNLNDNSFYYSLTKESVRLQISLTWACCEHCDKSVESVHRPVSLQIYGRNVWKCMQTMLWRVSGVCLYVLYVCVRSL